MNKTVAAGMIAAAFGLAAAASASGQPVDAGAAPSTPAPATAAPPAALALSPTPSVDWPYGKLMADPASRAVLARDIPNIVGYEYQDQIQTMTIREIAHYPQSGIDSAKLDAIQADLTVGAGGLTTAQPH